MSKDEKEVERKVYITFKKFDSLADSISSELGFVFCGKTFFCNPNFTITEIETAHGDDTPTTLKNQLIDFIVKGQIKDFINFVKVRGLTLSFPLYKPLFFGSRTIEHIHIVGRQRGKSFVDYIQEIGVVNDEDIRVHVLHKSLSI